MKKLATLLLAAGMVLGSFAGAQAIDWKVKGDWVMEFGVFDGLTFSKNTVASQRSPGGQRKLQYGPGANNTYSGDTFQAGQRTNIWVDAVASENLSGSLQFEIGSFRWGQAGTDGARKAGGAMGQRGVNVGVRDAFIDWFVPNTELKFRMGLQPLAIPGFAFGPSVFAQDVAGVSTSYKFNDNVSAVAFWARPYNDNYTKALDGTSNANGVANAMDNADFFGLLVPLSFDGFKVTPWGMIAGIGSNTFTRGGLVTNAAGATTALAQPTLANQTGVLNGLTPAFYSTHQRTGWKSYATAWWAGLTGEITAADPFRFAWDAVYGSVTYPSASYLNRQGWFLTALAEYKLDWGVPGLYFWWGSGDNSNPKDGSERLPVVDITNGGTGYSSMGFYGPSYTQRAIAGVSVLGSQFHAGSWGIGARLRDVSFIEDLKHTLRVNLFGGTNDPVNAKYMLGKKVVNGQRQTSGLRDFNTPINGNNGTDGNVYLTTLDYGLELNLDTSYKIYENLELLVELGYIHLWLDQSRSMWGGNSGGLGAQRGVNVTDALKAFMYLRYSF